MMPKRPPCASSRLDFNQVAALFALTGTTKRAGRASPRRQPGKRPRNAGPDAERGALGSHFVGKGLAFCRVVDETGCSLQLMQL